MSFMNNNFNRQQAFPAEPPSFSAGGHEMRDYYIDSLGPRPNPPNGVYLTPYLGLRARLSQTWINRWTVLILLVLIRLMLAIGSTNELIEVARADALSACMEVEKVATNVVSLPHYMAQGINTLTATGIDNAVSGLHTMADMTLTGVENIVTFYIGMLTNTYLCLTTMAVGSSVSASLAILEDAQGFLNTSLHSIGNEIQDGSNVLQTTINSLVGGINTVLGQGAPKVDFSKEINELDSLQLPTDLIANLQKLNASIPTYAQVKNDTDALISLPFEEVRKLMDQAWTNYTFNSSLLPVPAMDTVSFCSGNNDLNNFFDDLRKAAHDVRNIFLGVLITLAILACIPAALLELRRFAMLKIRSSVVKRFAFDNIDAIYLSTRPFSSDTGRWVAGRFSNSKTQVLVRWFVAYCTTLPALLLLSLALAGFVSCLFQLFLLRAIERQVPAIAAEIAGALDDVVMKVNNASAGWATDANGVLASAANDINNNLLGWVNTSTTAVNNTLNKFVDETIDVLNTTFFGTPLNDPVQDIFNCLIGIKVQGIEAGLTWVQQHAKVNLPMLPNNSMSLGDMFGKSSNLGQFLNNPTNVTQSDVSAAVNAVGNKIQATIKQEALIALGIFICWLIVVFCGFAWMLYKLLGSDVVRRSADHDVDLYPAPKITPPGTGDSQAVSENFNPKSRFSGSPTSPAPAYKTTFPDLNATAPYTLNPHPFPQAAEDADAEAKATRSSGLAFWKSSPANMSANPFQNSNTYDEKNGFL